MSQILLFKRTKSFWSKVSNGGLFRSFATSKQLPENTEGSLVENTDRSALNISIPKTTFNPRFHAVTSETKYHPLTTTYLYNWQKQRETKKSWVIHDLPMPVYDKLHLGHFYNKVMKDIMNRYKLLKGFKVDFSLGFNCHGTIVENSALIEEKRKENEKNDYSELEIREISRNYVTNKLKEYIFSLQRWGIMADYKTSYVTMNPLYEACVLDVFYELLEKKLIYKDVRPMFWSIAQRKPIDEDEVDHKYESKPGIFVKFRVTKYGNDKQFEEKYPNLYFLVFTSEPWTLTACQGISLHPLISYTVMQCPNGEQYIIATPRYMHYKAQFKKIGGTTSFRVLGDHFRDFEVKDPLLGKEIRVCFDNEIKPSFGSGINSVCPAHFVDDFKIAQNFGLDREGYVDERGILTEEVGDDLKGRNILRDASLAVKQKLKTQESLVGIEENLETIVYFHIQTKERVIIRQKKNLTSDQWFCRIPQYVKEDFLEELEKVKFFGPEGKEVYNSLKKEIEQKGEEWCISNTNIWGIPIPIFRIKDQKNKFLLDKTVISYMKKNFEKYGSDIWWQWSKKDLLPPKYKDNEHLFEKTNFVFDNWFESGVAWYAVLCKQINKKQQMINVDEEGRLSLPSGPEVIEVEKGSSEIIEEEEKGIFPAHMIVEGLDQNDGLALATCLIAANIKEKAPFLAFKNHAVIVDKELEKISKLSGNRILIEDIIQGIEKANEKKWIPQYGYGADVARLWVAASDNIVKQFEQVKIDTPAIDIKNAEINLIRKIYWELLRFTSNFKFNYDSDAEYQSPIDKMILMQLKLFMLNVEKAYESWDLSKVYRLYMDFMKFYVLDIYIETIKGRIITEPNTKRQKSAQRVCAMILENTILAIAPILCHNAENIYSHLTFREKKNSIFQNNWPSISLQAIQNSKELIPMFACLMKIREEIISQYEKIAERAKYTDTRLFEIYFVTDEKTEIKSLLMSLGDDLVDFLKCSEAIVMNQRNEPEMPFAALSSFKCKGEYQEKKFQLSIKIYKTLKNKCIRCYKYNNQEKDQICQYCKEFLPEGPKTSEIIQHDH